MALNFRSGPPKPPATRHADPIKIFESRPAGGSDIDDLWRGQADALRAWYAAKENDVLVSLNTGAGKSVVGLLICQSWVNQGVQNPVYLCPTNDLVEQTAAEARKLAFKFSTKTGGEFNNDVFESGQGFLITSYQTLLNALTTLRGQLKPQAVLFDDAHVGEPTIRGQFTLRIARRRNSDLHRIVFEAVYAALAPADRQRLRFVVEGESGGGSFLCPPELASTISETLSGIRRHVEGNPELFFPYLQLATHWHACAIVLNREEIEISPPFLPTRSLPVFRDQDIRRVYLSATLKAESEFVRAYGAAPGLRIEPEVDAGNGERAILSARKLKDGAELTNWAQEQAKRGKVLVAVPSRPKAEAWQHVAKVPDREDFNRKLNEFRGADRGGFVLAGRFDGIDLPDKACRLMILSGLPTGGTLLETYLWQQLDMYNLLAARVATRLTQLVGRIIRGRNDFGVFLLQGNDLTNWVSRDRNLALLPELLQQQLKLGVEIQTAFEVDTLSTAEGFFEQVMSRDEGWLDYYRQFLDTNPLTPVDVTKRQVNEEAQFKAALKEARFAAAIWERRFVDAATELEAVADEVASSDARLAGWLNLWVGAAYSLNGSAQNAENNYRIARSRLPLQMELPVMAEEEVQAFDVGRESDAAFVALAQTNTRGFNARTKKNLEVITSAFNAGAGYSRKEEAYRVAGGLLGFSATRPDIDFGAGPDVIWIDDLSKEALSFELKTEKEPGSDLTKKEVGQSHNHIQWIADNLPDIRLLRHFIVGDDLGTAANSNADHDWALTDGDKLTALVIEFTSEADRIRKYQPEARTKAIREALDEGRWSLARVASLLEIRKVTQ